jgi:hypothetical protein
VCNIHAPQTVTQTAYSGTISLKCRHLREGKNAKTSVSKSKKCKTINKKKGWEQSHAVDKENIPEGSHDEVMQEIDPDEEDDMF